MEAPPEPGRDFPAFPYDPYPIQKDFMTALYESLERGGVAMLESPTGTGKTLSIICSALQWIVDRRENPKIKENVVSTESGLCDEEPDWMRDFVADSSETQKLQQMRKNSCTLPRKESFVRLPEEASSGNSSGIEDAEFLLDDYNSGEDDSSKFRTKRERGSNWSSSEEEDEASEAVEEEVEVNPKIYFSSRTHSQLSQFINEFKKTKFSSELNAICLGSRKNLCINRGVLKLGNPNRINERCLELQKTKRAKKSKESKSKDHNGQGKIRRQKTLNGCPMIKKKKHQTEFRNQVLDDKILDIEDLVNLGNSIGTCPYYGSRRVIPAADVIILPYQSLLLKSARKSLGLNLKNSVVIIDEAHNLADSLANMYNSKITVSQLENVQSHLEMYLERFRSCLSAGNRRYIQTIMVILRSFLGLLSQDKEDINSVKFNFENHEHSSDLKVSADNSMTINEFLFSLDIDNINLVKLCQYIKDSNIIHKVSGYGSKSSNLRRHVQTSENGGNDHEGTIISSFQALSDLLHSLTYNNDDGRMIIARRPEEKYLKFVMLAGDKIFSEVIEDAQAVILAGGTLQPIEETRLRLFPRLSDEKFHFFSCNHIVPPENILPLAISRGPSNKIFDFSYNSRSSLETMEELGRFLCNVVTVVPEGIVVFFSSFEYESLVYETWKTSGILCRIQSKKRVFREPRSSNDVDLILKDYREAIYVQETRGALLLAVVGGKVSEGINFSDGMGRCVIMVGLPYPNPSDVELTERVKYIDRLRKSTAGGREYYENLCMKAVNQSVGRAIRHVKDYAAILLVDSRYVHRASRQGAASRPVDKLPKWIKSRLVFPSGGYGEVHRLLRQFFQLNAHK